MPRALQYLNVSAFLFQIGSIKSFIPVSQAGGMSKCFYSKLVRLKVDKDIFKLADGDAAFLFQIGSIKRIYLEICHLLYEVSIPNWFD